MKTSNLLTTLAILAFLTGCGAAPDNQESTTTPGQVSTTTPSTVAYRAMQTDATVMEVTGNSDIQVQPGEQAKVIYRVVNEIPFFIGDWKIYPVESTLVLGNKTITLPYTEAWVKNVAGASIMHAGSRYGEPVPATAEQRDLEIFFYELQFIDGYQQYVGALPNEEMSTSDYRKAVLRIEGRSSGTPFELEAVISQQQVVEF